MPNPSAIFHSNDCYTIPFWLVRAVFFESLAWAERSEIAQSKIPTLRE